MKATSSQQEREQTNRPSARSGWLTPARGCALSLIWGAFLAALCLVGASLATRSEFALRRGQPDEVRLWLIRDEVNRGFGFSTARAVERGQPQGSECYQTHVRFFLWRSDGSEPTGAYCQCFRRSTAGWENLGACPGGEGG